MVKFKCGKCGFEMQPLKRERTDPFARCPYCGTDGTMGVRKHILEELDEF